MKSLKPLLLTKSIIAAAIAASGMAAPAISHAVSLAGPSAGVSCRAGYTGALSAGTFTCSKARVISLVLECLNPTFPTYVTRAVVGSGIGKDLCTRAGVIVSSTDLLAGLILGQDYVFAEVNPAMITSRTAGQDQTEATALGLTVSEVDTVPGIPAIVVNGGIGNKDNANLPLTFFTAPIPNFGPIVIGNPGPFVPRALP